MVAGDISGVDLRSRFLKSVVYICCRFMVCAGSGSHKPLHAADSRKVEEPLAGALTLLEALFDRLGQHVALNLPPVLEAVGNALGDAVDANRLAVDSGVDHSLCEGWSRKPDEPNVEPFNGWLSGLAVNRHPEHFGFCRKDSMELECGCEARQLRRGHADTQ